jgi:signal transduction histidine kinase
MENNSEPGRLHVAVKPRNRNSGVDIIVSDTGEGMSEEIFEHLLDPYFTTKANGTGLGLAIANKIVDEHQGTISFSSRPGEGTTVTVSLPGE